MSTFRVLCVAAGGNAGTDSGAGGGGAGGFRDENDIELVDFTEYDVIVGKVAGNEKDSSLVPKAGAIETSVYSLSNGFNPDSETVDVSAVNAGDEIWVEVNVSGTQEGQRDGVGVAIAGNELDITYNGLFVFNVTSLVSGQSTVLLYTQPNSCSPTVTFKFSTGHTIKSFGGGRGGQSEYSDWDEAETGKRGGSGGGGGGARSRSGAGGTGIAGQGFNAGSGDGGNPSSGGTPSRPDRGGGGGGANGVGGDGGGGSNNSSGGFGGQGKLSDITGTNVRYAGGGAGSPNGTNGDGQANPGGGGNANATDKSGKDGLLVVRYTRADVTHTYTGGVITDIGGDRIHTFTSDGVLAPLLPSVGALML